MINCLLLDDEPLAIELLEDYIGKIPFLHMVAKCTNAVDALDVLNLNDIQLLFLDIRMPDIDGIQLLKSLSLAHRPLVVFTTGYPEYAIEGYNFEVLDYLLKPISFERFLKTASKAQFALHAGKNVPQQSNESRDFIFIKSDYKTIKVNFDDIIYIEGLKDYCKIYTTTGSILTLRSMKTVEQILPKERFARIHRSYIISISKIKMISKNQVIVNDDIHIPISESFKDNFNSIIDARQI